LQLWLLETESLEERKETLTWKHFEQFMKGTFGVIAPEKQARRQYDKLVQTGNVFHYVQDIRKLIQVMKPMPMICPGEADIVHNFISRAKPPLQEWLREKCPINFWKNSQEVFDKAIQYGTTYDPAVTRPLSGSRFLTTMAPKSFQRFQKPRNRVHQSRPKQQWHSTHHQQTRRPVAVWGPPPAAAGHEDGFHVVSSKKAKLAVINPQPVILDKQAYKAIVQKNLQSIKGKYTTTEKNRAEDYKCPCCGKPHPLVDCDPRFATEFLQTKGFL
jgi:hypothetical protein